jgi:ABC-type transporter Mla subunit MlaD
VKRFLQRVLGWVERHLFAAVHQQLHDIDQRLEAVAARLDEVQSLVEATAARQATATEDSLRVVESDARAARRFEEIERLLGAAPPGTR